LQKTKPTGSTIRANGGLGADLGGEADGV